MIPKPLDDIQKTDIDTLVSGKIAERRNLEYKEFLPGNSDEEKREFLYDASSFANAAGGDLIFGVRDQRGNDNKPTGVPDVANGVSDASITAEVSRLENLLQAGIAPEFPEFDFAK